jgi:hypothetical protein
MEIIKMGTKVVGKLDDWADADLGGNDFMNLEEGSNVVRVVTSPYQFYVAWTQDASGQNRKIRSAVENCPLAKRGDKIQPRWYIGVLDRRSNQPKILEVGRQIFQQVVALRKRDKWGDPRGYDVNIERQPKGSQPLYVVLPEPKEALTKDEVAKLREAFGTKDVPGRIDLNKLTEAPTPEEVARQLGLTEDSTSSVSVAATTVSVAAEVSATVKSGDDEEDFNFDDV